MYQLWHKYDKVLSLTDDAVVIYHKGLLPFNLRSYNKLTINHFNKWLSSRLAMLQRTYMNKLYAQRRIGRNHADIINDSAALSPVDLYWVTRDNLPHTWDSLQILRDESLSTALVSLTGVLDPATMFKKPQDHTSIFCTKGAFQKGIYNGYILKSGDNAKYEVAATELGNYLKISVAQAEVLSGTNLPEGTVGCKLFTNNDTSMAHASELLYDLDAETMQDCRTKALKYVKDNKKLLKEIQRLFLLNYLSSNGDMHEDNFGFLYDTKTFDVFAVAPAFDFNTSFGTVIGYQYYYEEIMELLPTFINENNDLVKPLKDIGIFLKPCEYLNDMEKNEVNARADYLVSLF
jgi:hypothetical protein